MTRRTKPTAAAFCEKQSERIRELEAELDRERHRYYNDRLREAIARAERAEAILLELGEDGLALLSRKRQEAREREDD